MTNIATISYVSVMRIVPKTFTKYGQNSKNHCSKVISIYPHSHYTFDIISYTAATSPNLFSLINEMY
jgi:hypothetical protein